MSYLFCDTETSGFKVNRIIQLAAILTDSNLREIACLNTLIKPDGWEIEQGAFEAHGIPIENCERFGVDIETALWLFDYLAAKADHIVCHNLRFDDGVIAGEYRRLGRVWSKPGICTMERSRDLVKIPPTPAMVRAGRRHFKNPTLMECHKHFFGCGFEGSHSAIEDVRATIKVFRELQK